MKEDYFQVHLLLPWQLEVSSACDCEDFSCSRNTSITVCGARDPENTDALCSDGLDNNNNGYTDCDDFECSRNENVTVCGTPNLENTDELCSDGIDNDENGFIDCDDFGCSRNENVTVCPAVEQ